MTPVIWPTFYSAGAGGRAGVDGQVSKGRSNEKWGKSIAGEEWGGGD